MAPSLEKQGIRDDRGDDCEGQRTRNHIPGTAQENPYDQPVFIGRDRPGATAPPRRLVVN
jgi:hypothetical protein